MNEAKVVTPKWVKYPDSPVWTLKHRGVVLEVRDVFKDNHAYARTGWDDGARWNLWVGHSVWVKNIAPTVADLKQWALTNRDMLVDEYQEERKIRA